LGELNIRKTELNVKKNIPTEKYTIDDYRLESGMPCQKGDSLLSGRKYQGLAVPVKVKSCFPTSESID
jgi:hypothetical protein